jgi:hypothetical protein
MRRVTGVALLVSREELPKRTAEGNGRGELRRPSRLIKAGTDEMRHHVSSSGALRKILEVGEERGEKFHSGG